MTIHPLPGPLFWKALGINDSNIMPGVVDLPSFPCQKQA